MLVKDVRAFSRVEGLDARVYRVAGSPEATLKLFELAKPEAVLAALDSIPNINEILEEVGRLAARVEEAATGPEEGKTVANIGAVPRVNIVAVERRFIELAERFNASRTMLELRA